MRSIDKEIIKKSIKIIAFIAIALLLMCKVTDIFERKNGNHKYKDFFAQEENFDVLFLGTSRVIDCVYPLELWKDYGIVSYNFAGHGNKMPTNYWVLINALDYTTPELVVLDCSTLSSEDRVSHVSLEQTHVALDAFPLTFNKIKAVDDLMNTKEEKLSFIYEFSVYHDRWKELELKDFKPEMNYLKGAEYHIKVAIPDEYEKIPSTEMSDINALGVEYAEKIIQECKKRNIEVFLIYTPTPASENRQQEANRAMQIAQKYDIGYINFLNMDIVDFETDCLDPSSHLNPSGGRKVTDYLGKYIIENYDIKDRREDINYAEWHNDYQEAVQYKLNKIKELDSLDKYLCMLADKNLNCCIYINEQEILQDERMRKLLENISLNNGLKKINEYQESDKGYFLLVDNNNRQIHEYLGENDIKITTSFGTVEYSNDFEMGTDLKINGSEYFNKEADVQIVLIDGISGEVKDSVSFVLDEKQAYVGATVLR